MVWPAIAGFFMIFSENEEDKKAGFAYLLALLSWGIFFTLLSSS